MSISRPLFLAPVLALTLALTACGSDSSSDEPTDANIPATPAPIETPEPGTSDPVEVEPTDSGAPDDLSQGTGSGRVILGDDVIELDPMIECVIASEESAAIVGFGSGDMGITFALEVLGADRVDFALLLGEGIMWAGSEGLQFVVNGDSLTGGGELVTVDGSKKQATFEFTC